MVRNVTCENYCFEVTSQKSVCDDVVSCYGSFPCDSCQFTYDQHYTILTHQIQKMYFLNYCSPINLGKSYLQSEHLFELFSLQIISFKKFHMVV